MVDLNVYDQTSDRVLRERWTAILALMESLGLVNLLNLTQPERGPVEGCPCKRPDCWHLETSRSSDALFATRCLDAGLAVI